MKVYCQQTLGWIYSGRSEAFNLINLWTGKTFLAIKFLKQESWTHRAETGKSENFVFGMPIEDWHLSQFMSISIGKLRFVDFKESTSVLVKFTFQTSVIEIHPLQQVF